MRIGVDMIEVARVDRAMSRQGERFLRRFFTPKERAICGENPMRLAARFAAKEATAKALGTGIGDVSWLEIEVDVDARNRPFLNLYGKAAELAAELKLTEWEVSLSHTAEHAIAFVVGAEDCGR